MPNYKQNFMRYMDSQGIKYTDNNEHSVRVAYTGDNLKTIAFYVYFDKEGKNLVQLRCWEVANFKGKEAKGIIICNDMNAKYRWAKFYLDKDADILVECDAYISEDCGPECLSLVRRLVNITDEAYPNFAKALWA